MAEEQALQEQPTETPPPPVAADTAPAAPEPEATPEPAKEEPKHGNTGKQPWFLQRISETTAKAREAEERAAAAERRAQEAEALAARLQTGGQQPGQQPQPTITPRSPIESVPADRRAEIAAAATAQRLYEDSLEVRNKGVAQFGAAFGESLGILQAVGATSDDFISDVLAVDKSNAHVLLDRIAKDPERAVTLAQMNSRQRIAELTRLTMAQVAPKTETEKPAPAPKQVSKAPAPPPPVTPSASREINWRADEATDEEFDKGFREMLEKRRARR